MCALTARLRAPAGTIAPSLHVIPPGTAPSLCHAPDPHCDHELAESQRISPSVQAPDVALVVAAALLVVATEVVAGALVVA